MGFTFSPHNCNNTTATTMAMKTALTLLVLFAIISTMEARSPLTKMAKMTKMAQMGNQAALVENVNVGCDTAHWCPNGCCTHETDMGNDGDWTCCAYMPNICAVDAATCLSP